MFDTTISTGATNQLLAVLLDALFCASVDHQHRVSGQVRAAPVLCLGRRLWPRVSFHFARARPAEQTRPHCQGARKGIHAVHSAAAVMLSSHRAGTKGCVVSNNTLISSPKRYTPCLQAITQSSPSSPYTVVIVLLHDTLFDW